MVRIKFKYKDQYSIKYGGQNNDGWNYQECIVRSVEECKKIYGLDDDCETYEIISVEQYESNSN